MGKKARRKKAKKNLYSHTVRGELEPNELDGQIQKLLRDDDWRLEYMDPRLPVYFFSNKKTHQVSFLGDTEAVEIMKESMDEVLVAEMKGVPFTAWEE